MRFYKIPIVGLDMYRISMSGDISSQYGRKNILKRHIGKRGYCYQRLVVSGRTQKSFYTHRLLMITFTPVYNHAQLVVNHINGDKLDNSLENLEWCTRGENVRHATYSGLNYSKLNREDVLEIRRLIKEGYKNAEIAKMFMVSDCAIYAIKTGRNWSWLN